MMVVVNEPTNEHFDKIGGALILLAVFVVYSPLRILVDMNDKLMPLFGQAVWQSLTMPGSPEYHYMWKPYILFQLVANVIFLLLTGITAALFFAKDIRFQKTFTVYLLMGLVASVAAYVLVKEIPNVDVDSSLKAILGNVLKCFVVISYLFTSKRVKGTFTNRITLAKHEQNSDAHLTSGSS